MNIKEFSTYQELKDFLDPMISEMKWAIDIRQNTKTGTYSAYWIEHKTVDVNGQHVPDEIWTNRHGEMTCVQDLDPEHAKNILRMILRAEREQRAMLDSLSKQLNKISSPEEEFNPVIKFPSTTLH